MTHAELRRAAIEAQRAGRMLVLLHAPGTPWPPRWTRGETVKVWPDGRSACMYDPVKILAWLDRDYAATCVLQA